MKKTNWKLYSLLLLTPFVCLSGRAHAAVYDTIPGAKQPIDLIDPTIGNVGQLLEPTRPTVQLPNQLIRFTPQRKDFMDDQISDFPLNVVSHRLGQVFSVKPATGALSEKDWQARMAYDHNLETNRPWYYSTWLLEEEVNVEFTAGKKTGYYRFRFPNGKEKSLLFGTYNDGEAAYSFLPNNVVTGMETYNDYVKVYLYGVFSEAGTTGVVEQGQLSNHKNIAGKGIKAFISFPATTKEVTFKYAISYISPEQAKKSYEEEISKKDFDAVAANGKKAWADVMNQVKVKGGTTAQQRSFYTALYRCYERAVDITEDGQYYSGYDKQIHKDNRPFYVDDWTWDTYLALHPLRMILNPAKEEDMLQSFVHMYEQSGWLPTFPVLFGDHACMNGFHSSVVMLDAHRKGLRNFDIEKAYEGMRKNATEATMLPWRNGPKTALDDVYHNKGYFPALRIGEKETEPVVHPFEKRQAVAVTLGGSYDDWALSELAGDLNKKDDQRLFAPRAKNYKNLWNADKQFFLPKDGNGEWIDINVKYDGGIGGRDFYDENNGWTYLWQVQQDIPGLISLMGGKDAFEKRLDQLFRESLDMSRYAFWSKFPDATGLVGQYSMGNEPSFHIPYLYNYTGAPWKTQQRIRFLLDTWFKDNIFGIPGDEDGGGMSAFVVFSSMGFYPVTPGIPEYTIGSPVFENVSIALPDKKQFTVIAHNSSVVNKYIQQAKFNGKPLNKPTFTHQQLTDGGTLELFMGPKPNKSWGVQ
ncbi:glycoside hydrolase family 92 protein [Chitinophaga ginsengisegetis]|uniref:GH92 family glycosyl hydrolase n=1 Tax=Chitinophaga ginsengisegetis TaxID=393003 RepID=UPI000DB9C764|nr:GH92 family glycosyl hydrolase [Chitinophaga ginsengisegetis]MDR6570946.1 putative alpha-1,2-mannosidase [Chitinophaga ginsengisegetis]MDR6650680.1 putative alpha-1,2-mannosidase [Chitinophaga ginsengisegetis]MDR6657030.1 putative alpha-1,2-mannosidase [Chitinophaga ginsengisegetis]